MQETAQEVNRAEHYFAVSCLGVVALLVLLALALVIAPETTRSVIAQALAGVVRLIKGG